ncbi:uncharacterized protein LOC114355108 [Ostrinia furnacalis]|uniref:uncharacterized protein LOC114355108 n=1 Tax=Ostrinia furnacalis TaxID=93504 RepID=UPI00103B0262|nr:uncharacterized protein LOC114355108 [Ostrinia furnacalis]
MSGPRWGERDTLKLIEQYKKYDFLWDYESKLYKNTVARKKAFEAILEELKPSIPDLKVTDVRSKIKNLRTSYYQEKRKMAIAKANNKPSKPLRWFSAFNTIMNSIYNRKVTDLGTDESDGCSEDETESVVPSEPNLQSESFLEVVPSEDSDTFVVSIKQEFLDEMENHGDKTTISDYLESVPKKRTKYDEPKSVEPPRSVESPKTVEIQRFSRKRSGNKVDEFQMFANNIAHQLRKLPLNRALNLQIEVQSLIAKERIEMLKKQGGGDNTEESS